MMLMNAFQIFVAAPPLQSKRTFFFPFCPWLKIVNNFRHPLSVGWSNFVVVWSYVDELFVNIFWQGVLDGKYDDLSEQSFYMVGGIDEVIAKAEKIAKESAA